MIGLLGVLRCGACVPAILLLAACHNEPKGQVVAIVNGTEITSQQLAAELQNIPVPDTADRAVLRKLVLSDVIDRELQTEVARKQGLDKSPEYLARKQRAEEQLLAEIYGHTVAQTVFAPEPRGIQDYIDAHPLQFAKRQRLLMDQLSFDPPRERRRLAILADVHTLNASAAALQSMGIMPVRGRAAIDTGLTDPALATQLDRLPPGEPILLPQEGKLIVGVVTGREPIALSDNDMKVAAARAVRAADLLRESQARIAAARSAANIHYEPGFEPDKRPNPPSR
jgi:EpsD family peptidyl-prolyl cis-trans isomerase